MNIRKLLRWNSDDDETDNRAINLGDTDPPMTPQLPPRGCWRPSIPKISIPLEEMQTMAQAVAQSGMFGVKDESQALSLMLLCQAEGLHPILALRRYHIIEGKPSMRADALQGLFEQTGAIFWHERTEAECSATFFRDKRQVSPQSLNRARGRYRFMKDGIPAEDFAAIGEMTIIRTIEDAIEKKVAMSWKDNRWQMKHNWKQSPRQMLHARCLSEGVRAVAPGLIAGIYTEDEVFDFAEDSGAELMTAEDRVRQATENRETGINALLKVAPSVFPTKAPDEIDLSPVAVTAENYNEVVCHIGKAEGNMLGKKVGEIHPNVLQWLKDHYGAGEGARWGFPVATEKDSNLFLAVNVALEKLAS